MPEWCAEAAIRLNGEELRKEQGGRIAVVDRRWRDGDVVELKLPMTLRRSSWYERTAAIKRGPLVYALRVEETWSDVDPAQPREAREVRPASAWNYALLRSELEDLEALEMDRSVDELAENPWTLENAPVELRMTGVRVPEWRMSHFSAADPPLSPLRPDQVGEREAIRLIPYGCTTLRITAFPWLHD